MTSAVSESAQRASRAGRRGRKSVLHRLVRAVIFAVFVIPVALILVVRFVPVPVTPLMLPIAMTDGPVTRTWVPLDAISPNLVRAVIASEDAKFCAHRGFDWEAIDQAMDANAAGSRLRGA